ncbi:MAG TPA: alpha-2-macroglobulin family protein, partial [Herpetosiphonaceae bacterium]|nr:alpha-2-macroglobulin family protein [Herpetosiphonaceae bacterium]
LARLSEPDSPPPAIELAPPTPLDPAAIRHLLAALPSIPPLDFPSIPAAPPLAEPIRPPAPELAVGPLPVELPAITLASPVGPVDLAERLSITFSQPMVSLQPHTVVARADVPVTIVPAPPGSWRWQDTRTLVFMPDERFPMATEYAVTVPPMRALSGGLTEPRSWTFSTPPPTPFRVYGPLWGNAEDERRKQAIPVIFDQAIDPDAIWPFLRLTADGRPLDLARPTAEDLHTVREELADRWHLYLDRSIDEDSHRLAVRSTQPWPRNSEIAITVLSGAPSAEGPLRTARDQSVSFRTYPPLRLSLRSGPYYPGTEWSVSPNNHFLKTPLDPTLISIDPPVPYSATADYGITIKAAAEAGVTYTVTIAPGIRDVFEQTLEAPFVCTITVAEPPPPPDAAPYLFTPDRSFVILPAHRPWHYTVFARNHTLLRVRLWAVAPEHWGRFNAGQDELGTAICATVVSVEPGAESISSIVLDLHTLCGGRLGQYILEVEPEGWTPAQPWEAQLLRVWVQISGLDLAACVCDPAVVVWASDGASGAALPGVALELRTASGIEADGWLAGSAVVAGATGADGQAILAEPGCANLLIARAGDEVAILPIANREQFFATQIDNGRGQLRWYVLSDRGLYRPGETARVKGWLRLDRGGRHGGLELPTAQRGGYVLRRRRGAEISRGRFAIGPVGGFDLAVDLPAGAAPEPHDLVLTVDGYPAHVQRLEVQEFRRPEFVMTVSATENPWVAGNQAQVTVEAAYYAGGPVADAEVAWAIKDSWHTLAAAKSFGSGWAWGHGSRDRVSAPTLRGRTDAAGRHTLALEFPLLLARAPLELTVEATVTDVNRQAWSASTTVVVHPARLYAGLRLGDDDLPAEDANTIRGEILVIDLEGQPVAGSTVLVEIRAVSRMHDPMPDSHPIYVALTSEVDPVEWAWTAPDPGQYRVRAWVMDHQGRLNRSEGYVSLPRLAPEERSRSRTMPALPTLKLSMDRASYQPGAIATVTIAPPFGPSRGIVSLHGAGQPRIEVIAIDGSAREVAVRMPPETAPNAQVQATLIDLNPSDAARRSDITATSSARLAIDRPGQRLILDAQPVRDHARPGDPMRIDFAVRNAAGQPLAGSEIAVFVVDEAVLDLSAYQMPDPIAVWYPYPDLYGSAHATSQHRYRPDAPAWNPNRRDARDELLGSNMRGLGGGWDTPPLITPPGLRLDLSPLACFAPSVITDESGRASVAFTLPDTLTRYRIMAVAVHGAERIGHAQATFTVGLPLMLGLAAPRFLRPGDRCHLTVLVHNRTDRPLAVALAAHVTQLDLIGAHGYGVRIPPLARAECLLDVAAPNPGLATIQLIASAGDLSDALSLTVPVQQPAASETSVAYGELADAPIREVVQVPPAALPDVGGLEITLATSGTQQMTDALAYLIDYPYGCAEQRASRLLALAIVQKRSSALPAGLPADARLREPGADDLTSLIAAQREDGGWGLWSGAEASWPYVSVHIAHALSRAEADPALAEAIQRAATYLNQLEQTLRADQPTVRLTVLAYAAYVLQRLGQPQAARIAALLGAIELRALPAEAAAWLLATLADQPSPWRDTLRQHLINLLHLSAGEAHVRTGYRDLGQILLFSERRVDALALFALLADQPENAAVAPLARGLLAGRQNGRWATTQENAFAVLALERYSAHVDREPPAGVARFSLDGQPLAEHRFSGQPGQQTQTQLPMAHLVGRNGAMQLTLSRQGSGRLHYRVALQAAVAGVDLPALRNGFALERRYAGAERARDVMQQPDGSWQFAVGTLVEVTLTVVATEARYHVALVDPIPAGCEILNAALATSSRLANQGIDGWRWPVRHIYDNRLELFAEHLPPGAYTLTYLLRTTSAGAFGVPGPWVEEMYHPEVAGRGLAAQVVII